jgi:phosphoglycerate dehydrogenase-like enzyme
MALPENATPCIAVLDDSQNVAMASADWSVLQGRASITVFPEPLGSEDAAAKALAGFDIIVMMRERTAFPASLIERLPRLKMMALTGGRAPTLDMAACTARGILVCNTGGDFVGAATPELAFGLALACARAIPLADATLKRGGWHHAVPLGRALDKRRMGIVGLGKLGKRMAGYAKAFGMEVVAWSENLTADTADAVGARLVSRAELFATSDVISLHLVLSSRTHHIVGKAELAAMKPGAILINTSRGPLVDGDALLEALQSGRIMAGLDVFDEEPLPANHPLRALQNVVLTPHLGYSTQAVFQQFYGESVANILAFLDGAPIRMVNPEALPKG